MPTILEAPPADDVMGVEQGVADDAPDAVAEAAVTPEGDAPAPPEPSPPPAPPRPLSQAEGDLQVTHFAVRRQANKVSRLDLQLLIPDRLLGDSVAFTTDRREDCEGCAARAVAESPLALRRPVLIGKLKAVRERTIAAQKAAEELRQEADRLEAQKPAPADLGERLVELDGKITEAEARAKSEAAQVAALQSALDSNYAGLEPLADRAFQRAHSRLHLDAMQGVKVSVAVLRAALTRCPELIELVNSRLQANAVAALESMHAQVPTKARVIRGALRLLGHTEEEPAPVLPTPPQPPAQPAGWQPVEPEQADAQQQQEAPAAPPVKAEAAPGESVYGGREGRSKIPRSDWPHIRQRVTCGGETQAKVAASYGCDPSRVSQILALLAESEETDAAAAATLDAPKDS